MSVLRALRKLVLGETLLLPLGVALTIAAALALRAAAPAGWYHAGGFVLLGGALAVLVAGVSSGARERRTTGDGE